MKLSDLANKLDCRLDSASAAGADVEITGVAGLEEAQPGQIAFLANKRYTPMLKTTHASAVFRRPKYLARWHVHFSRLHVTR